MYGYIRPSQGELKIRDAENYQAAYCGLCYALGRRCGPLARFTVSYDLTFLAMLLSSDSEKRCMHRCPRHWLKKRRCYCGGEALDKAADLGVILDWWKIRDAMTDERGIKRFAARTASLLLKRAYRKAAVREPSFDAYVRAALAELSILEKERCDSLDRAADCFARILAECSNAGKDEDRRALRELLYHVGRFIYILDAADDREEDEKRGSYNPLLYRFDTWDDGVQDKLRGTLNLSVGRAEAAFALLPENCFSSITENILTLGMPQMAELVLRGEWKHRKKHFRKYKRTQWSDNL